MKWASNKYREGLRKKASPKDKGFCPICGEEVISKCGDIKIWHWAHKIGIECDSFGEPETKWHLKWKDNFPEEMQEVSVKKCVSDYCYNNKLGTGKSHGAGHAPCNHINCADCDFKIHRADIKTKTGLVIEFQNSPISPEKIQEREDFYGNMIWVLNGKTFGKNITFFKRRFKWNWPSKSWDYAHKDIYLDYELDFIWKINLSNMTFKKLSKIAFIIYNGGNPLKNGETKIN